MTLRKSVVFNYRNLTNTQTPVTGPIIGFGIKLCPAVMKKRHILLYINHNFTWSIHHTWRILTNRKGAKKLTNSFCQREKPRQLALISYYWKKTEWNLHTLSFQSPLSPLKMSMKLEIGAGSVMYTSETVHFWSQMKICGTSVRARVRRSCAAVRLMVQTHRHASPKNVWMERDKLQWSKWDASSSKRALTTKGNVEITLTLT